MMQKNVKRGRRNVDFRKMFRSDRGNVAIMLDLREGM